MRRFAISDIHGCQLSFLALLDDIALAKEDELFLLGDYIDRGPRSRQVLDSIMALQAEGYRIHCLRGNHEQMMMDARYDLDISRVWLFNGGDIAMDSFQANSFEDVPDHYFQFLEGLSHYFIDDQFIFVHAGLNLYADNPLDDKKSMLWMRKWELQPDLSWLNGRIAVNGHTPQTRSAIEQRFDNLDKLPILNIDNGCAYYQHEGYHHLCAVDLTNMKLYFQPNID